MLGDRGGKFVTVKSKITIQWRSVSSVTIFENTVTVDNCWMFYGTGLDRMSLLSEIATCNPGLRGSMKRRTESALPNTTLQCGAGMVVTAVMGFFPSTASYERICLPEDKKIERSYIEKYSNKIISSRCTVLIMSRRMNRT